MARERFRGYDSVVPQTAVGAYKFPVPTHPVDRAGYPLRGSNSWFEHGVSDFLTSPGGATDMNVNGSVTPVEFSLTPPANRVYMLRSMLIMANNAGITATNFLGEAALVNGCLFRVMRGADVRFDFFGGVALTSTRGLMRRWLVNAGPAFPGQLSIVQIYVNFPDQYSSDLDLDGKLGDRLVFTVRDNLLGMDAFSVRLWGWKEVSV